jgi:hypothetical protein
MFSSRIDPRRFYQGFSLIRLDGLGATDGISDLPAESFDQRNASDDCTCVDIDAFESTF